jgi:uncharacterized membrane protein YjgN (DUF898 family)
MSLYFRRRQGARRLSQFQARVLASAVLACNIASFVISGPLGGSAPSAGSLSTLIGSALSLVSIGLFVPLVSSNYQRLVGEETHFLDEFELAWRLRANNFAFVVLGALTILLFAYLALAADLKNAAALWVPLSSAGWLGLLWLTLAIVLVLPTAYLAWMMPPPTDLDEVE